MTASLEWNGITLLDPWFLLIVPAVLLAALWRARRPRAALPTASAALFADIAPTLRLRLLWLPTAGKVLAAACLGVALARPASREVVPTRELGIDILIVVDTSSSMLTADMSAAAEVSRMTAARERAQEFAARRPTDRLGLIAFARYAELRCPPTLDEKALAAFLRALETVPIQSPLDGTAIGTAVAKGVQVLGESQAKSRVIVLLSDGENTVDDILPADAAKLAKDAGVRVHTIGLGNGIPTPFGFRPADFGALRAIAETTGGAFFQPRNDADLAAVYAEIDALEKSEIEDPRHRTVDRFELPLAAGLLLLVAALLAEAVWLRRVP